jgi:hypothetical protein
MVDWYAKMDNANALPAGSHVAWMELAVLAVSFAMRITDCAAVVEDSKRARTSAVLSTTKHACWKPKLEIHCSAK